MREKNVNVIKKNNLVLNSFNYNSNNIFAEIPFAVLSSWSFWPTLLRLKVGIILYWFDQIICKKKKCVFKIIIIQLQPVELNHD